MIWDLHLSMFFFVNIFDRKEDPSLKYLKNKNISLHEIKKHFFLFEMLQAFISN